MTASSGDWVESFDAWVWEPPYERMRVRGLSNATLFVRPGKFTMEARRVDCLDHVSPLSF